LLIRRQRQMCIRDSAIAAEKTTNVASLILVSCE
jgi:hypothetical protein